MGDEVSDTDSIWMPVGAEPPSIGTSTASGSRGRTWLRVVIAVLCFSVAGAAIWTVVRDDGSGTERLVGKAVSRTPRPAAGQTPAKGASTSTSSTTTTIVPSTVPVGATVKCGGWDAAFNGTPTITADGITIFSDFDGWHVRAKGPSVGTISGKITGVVQPNLYGTVSTDRVTAAPVPGEPAISFSITPGPEPVGFDFSAGCAQKALRFEVLSDSSPINPKLVHLGTRGGVVAVPFEALRSPEPPG